MLWANGVCAAEQYGKLRFATPGVTITTLPMEVARRKGFDKSEGFTAAFTTVPGSIAVKAMLAGDFEFGLSPGSALAGAVSGAAIKIVYVNVDKLFYFLFAREGIANLKDLEGKRVGVDAIGGSTDFAVRHAMEKAGADPSKPIYLAMGIQAIPGAMIAGAIDAGVMAPPREFQLINAKAKFNNLGFLGDITPGLAGGIATTQSFARSKPEVVRAVMRAQRRGCQFIIENREETAAIMSEWLGLSIEDARKSYDTTVLPHLNVSGFIPESRQTLFITEQAKTLKLATTPPAASTIFDFSFLPK